MAKSLGVSRGSFYWHFKDLAEFQTKLLVQWQKITTEIVIQEIDQGSTENQPLEDLATRAFLGKTHAPLDKAVRHWAQYEPKVQRQIVVVDRMRIQYLAKLLMDNGLKAEDANRRARLLYAASLGNTQIPDQSWPEFTSIDIAKLVAALKG